MVEPCEKVRKAASRRLRLLHESVPPAPKPDPRRSVFDYLRAAATARAEGVARRKEGDTEGLYMALLRFSQLTVVTIPAHPGFKSGKGNPSLIGTREWFTREAGASVAELEQVRRVLRERYEMEEAAAERARELSELGEGWEDLGGIDGMESTADEPSVGTGNGTGRSGKAESGDEPIARFTGVGTVTLCDNHFGAKKTQGKQGEETQEKPVGKEEKEEKGEIGENGEENGKAEQAVSLGESIEEPTVGGGVIADHQRPIDNNDTVPGVVDDDVSPSQAITQRDGTVATAEHDPVVSDSTAASKLLEAEARTRGPLRPVVLPTSLLSHFLHISAANTAGNIETCGILSGTLTQGTLTVTALVIPEQTGTSDTCTALNEEDLLMFHLERDLLMLGWIHTHPRQSLFCSSQDLHTHHGYQLTLPEAIAVVMAPSFAPNYGVFRIIEPEGMDELSACGKDGFHRHRDVPIYTYATHVEMASGDGIHQVYDLRRNK